MVLVFVLAVASFLQKKPRKRKNPWVSTPKHLVQSRAPRNPPLERTFDPPASPLGRDASAETTPVEWDMDLLRALEWKRFEEACKGFWVAKGYSARLTSAGPDGGIDVVIPDQADPNKIFAVAQCKAWAWKVGVEQVRALWGTKHHFDASLAVFYGLSGFTEDAKSFADGKHLKLVAGEGLLRQIHSLSEEHQDALLKYVTRGDYTTPSCPNCDVKMVLRTGVKGRSDFWGCPRYRSCGARPIAVRSEAMQRRGRW